MRKSFRLKLISSLEAFHDISTSDSIMEISLQQRAFTGGESKLAFEAASEATRTELIGILYSFCKSHEKKVPTLLGIHRNDLGVYGQLSDHEDDDDNKDREKDDDEYDDDEEDDSNFYGDKIDRKKDHTADDNNDKGRSATLMNTLPSDPLHPSYKETSFPSMMKSYSMPVKSSDSGEGRNLRSSILPGGGITMQHRSMMHTVPGTRDDTGVPPLGATQSSMHDVADEEAAWTKQNEKEITAILDAVAGRAACLEEAQHKVNMELSALHDANVHELLESAANAAVIQDELRKTLGFVDDLEETLGMFDAKLRHIQDDMSAIEEWNNKLEACNRDNGRLLHTLESLTMSLTLPKGVEEVVRRCDINNDTLDTLVDAAWILQQHMHAIEATSSSASMNSSIRSSRARSIHTTNDHGLPDSKSVDVSIHTRHGVAPVPVTLKSISAVKCRQRDIRDAARQFVQRASSFLSHEYEHIADSVAASVIKLPVADRCRVVSHGNVHVRARQLKPLLEVIACMQPGAAATLRTLYCRAVNELLKKEIGGAAKEMLKQAVVASAGSPADPDITVKAVGADSIKYAIHDVFWS